VSGFFAAHIYIIITKERRRQNEDATKERERERKRFENACNNHPNNRDTYQSYYRKRKICSRLSTQISKFFRTPTHFARERRRHPTKTISLSLSDGIFTEGPNVASS
jgi:hypothetical protein